MSKFEKEKLSIASLKKEAVKNSDLNLEYCDVCFIALGSQEKRIYRDKNVTHLDCVKK